MLKNNKAQKKAKVLHKKNDNIENKKEIVIEKKNNESTTKTNLIENADNINSTDNSNIVSGSTNNTILENKSSDLKVENVKDTVNNNINSQSAKNIKKITDLNRKKLPRFYIYFIYFLVFSIIGWLLETCFSFYYLGHFTKRGFLFGPLCPIYGWGALILIIFFSTYKRHNFKLFIYSAIIFTLFEYLVSFGMEALFSLKWWDYTDEVMNLNSRVSIFYTFAWGIIAILFINFVYPFFKKKINTILSKIPYKMQLISVNLFMLLFIADTLLSCVKYLI